MTAQEEFWRPSCTTSVLKVRAAMLRSVRNLFHESGYMEVETPVLSQDIVVDSHIDPLQLHDAGQVRFLQTSPEAAMKRLLSAGSGSIFQIGRVFRRGEQGSRHNPEFTMLEWYGVRTSLEQQMELTERLVRTTFEAIRREFSQSVARGAWGNLKADPFRKTTYEQAFRRVAGFPVLDASVDDIVVCAAAKGIDLPEQMLAASKDDLLNVILAAHVEPKLGIEHPEMLYAYPASQCALAEIDPQDSRTARRFELYMRGIEICNGYQELTDPKELARRDQIHNGIRRNDTRESLPGAPRLHAAMNSGLPPASGVALGFDRLVMLALACDDIRDVLPFPYDVA